MVLIYDYSLSNSQEFMIVHNEFINKVNEFLTVFCILYEKTEKPNVANDHSERFLKYLKNPMKKKGKLPDGFSKSATEMVEIELKLKSVSFR